MRKNVERKHKGSVRIVGGRWRGRRLPVPPGVRPTPDRARETLFNWLAPVIEGARCLDLCAGTGVLGLEALSRGAAEAWLVERDRALADALRERAVELGANARVVNDDAGALLERAPVQTFDIAFLDPPYEQPVAPWLAPLAAWMAPGGLIYLERSSAEGLPDPARIGARLYKASRAGAVEFGLLRLPG